MLIQSYEVFLADIQKGNGILKLNLMNISVLKVQLRTLHTASIFTKLKRGNQI